MVDLIFSAFYPRSHHRARLLNAKRITGKSAAELAEVLGVAPSSSTNTTTQPGTPTIGFLTPISDEPAQKIMTSTTNVSDYFREKMKKLQGKHKWMNDSDEGAMDSPTPVTPILSSAPVEEEDCPRVGLGAQPRAGTFDATRAFASSLSSTRAVVAGLNFRSTSSTPAVIPPLGPTSSISFHSPINLDEPKASNSESREKTPKNNKKRSRDSGPSTSIHTPFTLGPSPDRPATLNTIKSKAERRARKTAKKEEQYDRPTVCASASVATSAHKSSRKKKGVAEDVLSDLTTQEPKLDGKVAKRRKEVKAK